MSHDLARRLQGSHSGCLAAGGSIGILLGFALSEGVTYWMTWPTAVSPQAVFIAFGFAALTGVFFGFYPARKAAALDPIDALRFE